MYTFRKRLISRLNRVKKPMGLPNAEFSISYLVVPDEIQKHVFQLTVFKTDRFVLDLVFLHFSKDLRDPPGRKGQPQQCFPAAYRKATCQKTDLRRVEIMFQVELDPDVLAPGVHQLRLGRIGDDPAPVENDDPVAEFFRLLQVMGGENDRRAQAVLFPQEL